MILKNRKKNCELDRDRDRDGSWKFSVHTHEKNRNLHRDAKIDFQISLFALCVNATIDDGAPLWSEYGYYFPAMSQTG